MWQAGVVSGQQRTDGCGDGPDPHVRVLLHPPLQGDDRVTRIVGIAPRPFDLAAYGWTKLEYRRGDVRDPAALRDAFAEADVVVHLAFLVTGAARPPRCSARSTSRAR